MRLGRLRGPETRILARRRSAYYAKADVGLPFGTFAVMLLIVVMVIPHPHGGFPVDPPTAWHSTTMSGAMKEDAIKMFVTRDGAIYFGHHAIDRDESNIRDQIRVALARGAESKVYLYVDARTRYDDASVVLDAIRHAGVTNLSLITSTPASQP